jgi:hypothetical protein
MTIVNENYEFVVEEGKVYEVRPSKIVNRLPCVQITGTGSVNLRGSLQRPATIDSAILTLNSDDENLNGFYHFEGSIPNFIKFEESEAGERVITLSGFAEPIELEF